MSIDWSKPLRTVEGHYPVRIYSTELKGCYPILITVDYGSYEDTTRLNIEGKLHFQSNLPYVENIPEEKFVWIAVYESEDGTLIPSIPKNSIEDLNEAAKYYSTNLQKELVGRLKVKLERRFDE